MLARHTVRKATRGEDHHSARGQDQFIRHVQLRQFGVQPQLEGQRCPAANLDQGLSLALNTDVRIRDLDRPLEKLLKILTFANQLVQIEKGCVALKQSLSNRFHEPTGVGNPRICLNSQISLPKHLPKKLHFGATLFPRPHLLAFARIEYIIKTTAANACFCWVFKGLLKKWRREGDSNPRYGF